MTIIHTVLCITVYCNTWCTPWSTFLWWNAECIGPTIFLQWNEVAYILCISLKWVGLCTCLHWSEGYALLICSTDWGMHSTHPQIIRVKFYTYLCIGIRYIYFLQNTTMYSLYTSLLYTSVQICTQCLSYFFSSSKKMSRHTTWTLWITWPAGIRETFFRDTAHSKCPSNENLGRHCTVHTYPSNDNLDRYCTYASE